MFISKKYHEARVRALEDSITVLCAGHTNLVSALQAQISDLRALVFPKMSQAPDPVVLEADSVITGSDKPSDISEEEHNRFLEEAREADLIVSGNYDSDLLN